MTDRPMRWVFLGILIAAGAACGDDGGGATPVDAPPTIDAAVDAPIDAPGLGASCTAGADCGSGFCADSVCCDAACGAACDACTAALTGGVDGICAPAFATVEPAACAGFRCGGETTTCPTTCTGHADCAGGFVCAAGGACVAAKRMFVSSTVTTGNLGGLAGADATCAALASAAGLPGTFKAWLSDSTRSAASRLTHFTGPYYRVHEDTLMIVATSWADLVDTTVVAVSTDERGVGQPSSAWTGTNFNAEAAGPYCQDWRSSTNTDLGMRGIATGAGTEWTAYGPMPCDTTNGRLYCIEQ